MTLDDFDWRSGEMVIHGKGGHLDRLPIPPDVGEALVDYIVTGGGGRSAGRCSSRRSARRWRRRPRLWCSWPRTASECAGEARVAGHRFRHTAATAMLAGGVSMREVGGVLRHDDDTTTSIYAKADQASLRVWPAHGRGSGDDRLVGRPG